MKLVSKDTTVMVQPLLEPQVLLESKNVKKRFSSSIRGSFFALNGVSISLKKGELITIIGESGSGKTTLARIMAGLIPPTGGEVFFGNKSIFAMDREEMQYFRRKVQFIPQYPDLALDPTWYVYDSIAEPLRIHRITRSKKEEFEKVQTVSSRFGLSLDQLRRKPRDLSGGELQRSVLARSMVLDPDVIIADEPTSMLDPSTQAKIVRQILEAKKDAGFGVLFVTHDLELTKAISDRVFVMFGGNIVESGNASDVFLSPLHPYTSSLISGFASGGEAFRSAACPFYSSCDLRIAACLNSAPPELSFGEARSVRCWIHV